MPDDKKLISAYLQGDLDAFEDFYRKYKDSLFTYIRNRADQHKEDLFQETWEKFIKAVFKRSVANPAGYLFQIARNLITDHYRKPAREISVAEPLFIPQSQDEDEYLPDVPEELVQQALEKLACNKPAFYDVLHLHIFSGMTFDEISVQLAENINTIKSRYRYALTYLRNLLNDIGCAQEVPWISNLLNKKG